MGKILLIEDDLEVRSVLVKWVRELGLEYITASDTCEAESVLASEAIDLAIVDIDISDNSALDFLSHARIISSDTVVIMVTGGADQRSITAALKAGIFAYILKPIEKEQLMLLMKNALRQKEIEIENRRYRESLEEMLAAKIESLKQSQAKLNAIASYAYDPIILIDDKAQICFWNRAAEKVFGYSEDEALGMSFQGFIVGDIASEMRPKGQNGSEPKQEHMVRGKDIEAIAVRKNGEKLPIELSLSLLELEGKPHILAIARDITERKRTQEQREFELKRFISIFDSLTEFIYVSDPVTYEVLYVNKTMQKALGKNPIGGLCYREFQGFDRPCSFCTNGKILKDRGRPYYWEFYNSRARRHFKIVDQIIRWPDGRDVRFEFAMDISDLKKAQKQLKKAHEKSILLLKAISSILIAMDDQDKIIEWNVHAEKALQVPAEKALGRRLRDLDLKWDLERITEALKECKSRTCDIRVDDIVLRRDGGKNQIISMTISCIEDEDGRVKGTMIRAADITERKLLENQLAQAQKLEAIGQLAAGIAHEINTPVQFIGDNLHFLSDAFVDLWHLIEQYEGAVHGLPKNTESQDSIEKLRRIAEEIDLEFLKEEIPKALDQSLEGVARVTKIVGAMKEFSHPGSSEKIPVDINHAIENTITVAKNEWKYVADVETDFDPTLPLVPCLPGDLNQVFLNIIINAAHAIGDVVGDGSNSKGKIRVATRKDDGWAEIRISDTGLGIPDEIRDRIFDPFFTTKEVGKGTGQGLSIAHSIVVKKHGGTIDFESQEGKGTTFIVRLPLAQDS